MTWWGWHIPTGIAEAGVVALLGLTMLTIAIAQFGPRRVEPPITLAPAE